MAITVDKIAHGMTVSPDRLVLDKATITSQAAGTYVSLWRATGQPGQGAIPSTAAVCNNSLTGCFGITNQTDPVTGYLGYFEYASSNSAMTLEIHDRLMHMGGLSGTVTTAQTANVDLDANLATDNLTNRIGASDYSDVQWWLEWYTATGSSAVTATVNVTYNDASTGNLTGASLSTTRPASFMLSLNNLIPSASSGKYIQDVNSVTLSATTGTAGSFGITATRLRGTVFAPIANAKFGSNWADLPISEVPNYACLFPVVLTSTTSSGTARGGGKVIHVDPT